MAVVDLWPPLGYPMQYDPSFKVEVNLREPLLVGAGSSTSDVMIAVMSVSSQLDMLCKKELKLHQNERIDNGKVSNLFEAKAAILLQKLNQLMTKLPSPQPSPEDYLDYTGIGRLYPRAAAYVTRPTDLSLVLKKTVTDDYFPRLSALQQLVTLAHQINSDVTALTNHKYIAHQIALLYQSLTALGDVKSLTALKKDIHTNFGTIKDSLAPQGDDHVPRLSEEESHWLLDVTNKIVQFVTLYPEELTKEMFPVANVISQF